MEEYKMTKENIVTNKRPLNKGRILSTAGLLTATAFDPDAMGVWKKLQDTGNEQNQVCKTKSAMFSTNTTIVSCPRSKGCANTQKIATKK